MAADKGELRALVSMSLLQALDAIALARGLDRTELVTRILTAEVKQISHEAILVARMLRGNPLAMESDAQSGGNGEQQA
jgi:hypothetical protein